MGALNPLKAKPYERDSKWQCNKCRKMYGGYLIRATLNITRALIDDYDGTNVKVRIDPWINSFALIIR